MRLPSFLCEKYHRTAWNPRPQLNIKTGREYKCGVWCYRCKTVRYILFWKCQSCGFYFIPKIYADHRRNCKLTIQADVQPVLVPNSMVKVPAADGSEIRGYVVRGEFVPMHPFEGIVQGVADRDCTRCGLPDRDPIHYNSEPWEV